MQSRLQQREAFGDCGSGVFLAFELKRDVAFVVVLFQHLGNAWIIQIQRVPSAATVVCFGLHQYSRIGICSKRS